MSIRASRRAVAGVLVLAPWVIVLAACSALSPSAALGGPVKGEGSVTTEDRTTSDFQRVSVGAGIQVVASTGSPTTVSLAAQPNLLPLIETAVSDGQLVVTVKSPGISSTQPVMLTVMTPDLQSITLSSGSTGTLELMSDALKVDVSAGATLEATGRTRLLDLTASSGAKAMLANLITDTATVAMSGGASAELSVVGKLTGTASGGSTIHLQQKPGSLDVTTSGGATVQGG